MNLNQKNTQSTETFLQKLLGRNYKWWFTILYYFKTRIHYKIDVFFYTLQSSLKFSSSIFIWFLTIQQGAKLDLNQILTYFLLGNIFGQFSTSIVDIYLFEDVKSGRLNVPLLRPSNLFLQYFTKSLGSDFMYFLWNIFFLSFLIAFFWTNIIFTSWIFTFFAILLALISRILIFFFQVSIGSVSFWSTESRAIIMTSTFFVNFLSGSLFPLDIIYQTKWLIYNPFAFTFYHPMQIYLGKYDTFQTFLVFLGGIFWCVFLYFIAKFVFKMGLKRNESVGL